MPPRVAIRRINDSALAATFPCPVRRVSLEAGVRHLPTERYRGGQASASHRRDWTGLGSELGS